MTYGSRRYCAFLLHPRCMYLTFWTLGFLAPAAGAETDKQDAPGTGHTPFLN